VSVMTEASCGESAGCIPWEAEWIVSATVVHVEWAEEELLRIEYGGFGRERLAGVISRRVRVIEH
jgi:hypothetical protein